MYISYSAVENKVPAEGVMKSICPYKKVYSMFCSASVMQMRIDQRRNMVYCLTEDFDSCPVFLAKVLRGN